MGTPSVVYLPSSLAGHKLHTLAWGCAEDQKPRAVAVLVHGMAEHIARYDRFARYLNDRGIAVFGASHLGHGLTAEEGELGYFAKMNGAGVLTFTYKISHNSADWNFGWNFFMYKDEDYVSVSYAYNRWEEKRIVIYEGGEHQVSFNFYDDSMTGDWTVRLSDFVWTPAPEKMTVSFNANGGDVTAEPREYAPGNTYSRDGDEPLPVPTRSGWTFLGWYMDSVDGVKVSEDEKVPFQENITLVAKWGKAVTASIFADITSFKNFKVAGADKWYMVEVPDFGTVAEVMPKGK